MKLLITGSTGFVGRNLLLQALRDPFWSEIILPVRNTAKLLEQLKKEGFNHQQKRLHLCSVSNNDWILPASPFPDITIHCAGLTFSREKNPYFTTHVEGTLNLLKALPSTCRLLFLSSQSAAGPTPTGTPIRNRNHSEEPHSWYGESKLAIERELASLISNRLLILRPPMILGARDTATVPLFQMAQSPIRIKPGLQTKKYSWIAVDDLCQALLIAAKSDWKSLPYHNYFLSSNQIITDLELLKVTADVVGTRGITFRLPHTVIKLISVLADKIPALHQPLQSLGPDRVKEILSQCWVIDGSDFQHDFDWSPTSSLRESLEKAFAWLNQEPH